jgi:hypothetical protein
MAFFPSSSLATIRVKPAGVGIDRRVGDDVANLARHGADQVEAIGNSLRLFGVGSDNPSRKSWLRKRFREHVGTGRAGDGFGLRIIAQMQAVFLPVGCSGEQPAIAHVPHAILPRRAHPLGAHRASRALSALRLDAQRTAAAFAPFASNGAGE